MSWVSVSVFQPVVMQEFLPWWPCGQHTLATITYAPVMDNSFLEPYPMERQNSSVLLGTPYAYGPSITGRFGLITSFTALHMRVLNPCQTIIWKSINPNIELRMLTMKIVIPGGSGQVGMILSRAFHFAGHEVVVLSRNPQTCPLAGYSMGRHQP